MVNLIDKIKTKKTTRILLIIICLILFFMVLRNLYISFSAYNLADKEDIYTKKVGVYTVEIAATTGIIDNKEVFLSVEDIACSTSPFYVKRWLAVSEFDNPEYDAQIRNNGQYIDVSIIGDVKVYIGNTKNVYIDSYVESINFPVTVEEFLLKEENISMSFLEIVAIISNFLLMLFAAGIFVLLLLLIIRKR